MHLPKVYPITDIRLSGRSHAEQVRQLVAAGASFIQLREKHLPARQFQQDAAEAIEFARRHDAKIIINDRVDVALALDADGVHLGQDDLPPAEARKLLGSQKLIGFSTHNIEQAIDAVTEPIDYIAIGPIFTTSTKEDPDPIVGLEMIARVRALIALDLPLVAIGGIDPSNISSVIGAGADSAAVIGRLFSEGVPIGENFRQLARLVTDR